MQGENRTNLADIKPREDVDSSFLVKYIAQVEGKNGQNFLNIILADKTGEVESRMWSFTPELIEQVQRGSIVQVKGKMNLYQNRKQFVVTEIKALEKSQYNVEDYIVKAGLAPEEMYQRLIKKVEALEEFYIKDLLLLVLSDEVISERLKYWQAGKSIHHAYRSGLLEHILSCCDLADFLSNHYQVNRSYVIAGCILHDLGKIYELTDGLTVDYTEEGKLVGHLVKGVELLDKFSSKVKQFPKDVKMHLKHLLVSHHGSYQYGSPKLPQTAEAFLLHLIDYMDSKMNSVQEVKRTDKTPGHWSNFIKHLDTVIYKEDLPSYTNKPSQNNRPASKELKQNLGKLLQGYKADN